MERRKTADRRKVHMFVSEDRRKGPYDRRGADIRRRERAREMEKIQKIKSFRKNDTTLGAPAAPAITKKQMVWVGLALLLLAVALFGIN